MERRARSRTGSTPPRSDALRCYPNSPSRTTSCGDLHRQPVPQYPKLCRGCQAARRPISRPSAVSQRRRAQRTSLGAVYVCQIRNQQGGLAGLRSPPRRVRPPRPSISGRMSGRPTLSSLRKEQGRRGDDFPRQCRPERLEATRPHSRQLQKWKRRGTSESRSSTSPIGREQAPHLACPSSPLRRRGTRRPSPQRMTACTIAGYAVRTGTPCTPARSCRPNNGCSQRR